MMPLMFGLVGASVNFKTIDKSIIPKAVAIVVAGQPLSAACSSAPQASMHTTFKLTSYVLERISSDKAAYQVLLVTGESLELWHASVSKQTIHAVCEPIRGPPNG